MTHPHVTSKLFDSQNSEQKKRDFLDHPHKIPQVKQYTNND